MRRNALGIIIGENENFSKTALPCFKSYRYGYKKNELFITAHFEPKDTTIAARREISQRKSRLLQDLRSSHRKGELIAGEVAPSVRDLAQKYELSVGLVVQQMQVLVQEGLFYTVAGAGTFVGQRALEHPEFYLYVISAVREERDLKNGFEEEIARRGGTTLVMTREQVLESKRRDLLPAIQGVFIFQGVENEPVLDAINPTGTFVVPEVNFDDRHRGPRSADTVNFDDIDGGRQAAQHLLRNGHQEIAFLAIHAEYDNLEAFWSVERMQGWQQMLAQKGIETGHLAFFPERTALRAKPDSAELLTEAAHRVLRSGATAIVTASDDVAQHLINACREVFPSPAGWPAIVSFDGTLSEENHILTSLRLPWGDLGRNIASTLWERAHGQLTGEPVHRSTAMRMIPRLTCQANWSLIESLQAV